MADETTHPSGAVAEMPQPTAPADTSLCTDGGFDRVDRLTFGLTTAVAFAGYWFTLAPNLTLVYSGIMSTGAMYAGVPHVPGYPVWTIYSWCFTKLLPFSNIACGVAVSSAVASTIACGLVAMMVSRCGSILCSETARGSHDQVKLRIVCGVVAGLVLAFSGVVWRYAVVADIWALSLLLFVGMLAALQHWMLGPAKRRFLALAFFLFGMLLTSSQELIVVFPGFIMAVMIADSRLGRDAALLLLPLAAAITSSNQYGIWVELWAIPNQPLLLSFVLVLLIGLVLVGKTRRLGTEWRGVLLCAGAFLLGLAFYFYVPIASMTTPPVNWGYPRTAEGFFHVIGRGQFERLNPVCDPFRFWDQCCMWIAAVGKKFGWLQLLVALTPFCFFGQMGRTARRWLLALVAVGFGAGPLLLAELNPPPDRQAQELVELYFGAWSYVVLAVWLGLGLMLCGRTLARAENRADS